MMIKCLKVEVKMGSEVKIFGGMYYHRYSYVVCMRVAIYYL